MTLRFRDLRGEEAPTPQPGELLIRPRDDEEADRRDLASFLLAHGVGAFLGGDAAPDSIEHVVVSADPTLDDLLAARFAAEQLAGRELPPGAKELARYAALVREGLQPGDVPLKESIEGLFLAMRAEAGRDLSEKAAARRFRERWEKMAEAILAAAAEGHDPFREALFRDDAEFARERAFLAQDHDVYHQDVLRGERWRIQLPGGPPAASALVLREPKAILAKQWSRRDAEAPTGDLYLFLAVDWGDGHWVFSTDPVQRLAIRPLAQALQEAELAVNPAAEHDPWFDGAPFNYTLVAAPNHGSKLGDKAILAVVRKWLSAKPVRTTGTAGAAAGSGGGRSLTLPLVIAAVLVAALVLGGFYLMKPGGGAAGGRGAAAARGKKPPKFRSRGLVLSPQAVTKLKQSQGVYLASFAIIVCVGNSSYPPRLPAACKDAAAIYRLLRDAYGFKPEHIKLLIDDPAAVVEKDGTTPLPYVKDKTGKRPQRPTRSNLLRALEELSKKVAGWKGRTNFVFFYAGHGHPVKFAQRIGYLVLDGCNERALRVGGGQGDKEPVDAVCFDMGEISRKIRTMIPSTHQLLLVDSCFSGFVRARGTPRPDAQIYALWKEKAHEIITAGTSEQRAWEGDDHSHFTKAVLLGLGDGLAADLEPTDGIVTGHELAAYVRSTVANLQQGQPPERRQTPQHYFGLKGDDVGQFLFLRRTP